MGMYVMILLTGPMNVLGERFATQPKKPKMKIEEHESK